jgi:hypothetical protein
VDLHHQLFAGFTGAPEIKKSAIPVGTNPIAFGIFIQPTPPPRFAGTPGFSNCHGKSVSALAQQYGGLAHAAAALDYSSVSKLQSAVAAYCGG